MASQVEETRPDESLAFSRIKEEIQKIAKEKADEIIKEANDNANEILKKAKDQANSIKNKITEEAKRSSENLKVQEVSRKKLSIKMDYLKYRDQLFDEIQVEATSKIQKYTQSTKYKSFLLELAKASGISIGGGELSLILRKEDKTIFPNAELNKLSKEISNITNFDSSLKISDKELRSIGGLKIVRKDNKLFVDNSFEARLQRKTDEIRTELLKLLN